MFACLFVLTRGNILLDQLETTLNSIFLKVTRVFLLNVTSIFFVEFLLFNNNFVFCIKKGKTWINFLFTVMQDKWNGSSSPSIPLARLPYFKGEMVFIFPYGTTVSGSFQKKPMCDAFPRANRCFCGRVRNILYCKMKSKYALELFFHP